MAVKIAHASIAETGGVNGKAGDQTGREVCIRNWWNFGYSVVLRCKDENIRNKMVQLAQDGCWNNNIGYSQAQRNTLHNELKRNGYNFKAVNPCNTDCSAFITAVAIGAGVRDLEYVYNAPTTSTMVNTFGATGLFQILRASDLVTTDKNLWPGDILVAPGNHVVMALEWGQNVLDFFASLSSQNHAKANVYYQVRSDGKHYAEVKNLDDYAGVQGRKVEKLAMKVDKGTIMYRVHLLGKGWLPWVYGYNWWDNNNGYAGLTEGHAIDAIQINTENTGGKIKYRVSTTESSTFLPWVVEDTDYAGVFGKCIDKIQAFIE